MIARYVRYQRDCQVKEQRVGNFQDFQALPNLTPGQLKAGH